MKSFALAAFIGLASAWEAEQHFKFQQYLSEHGKSYRTVEEYEYRLENFMKKDAFINWHNASGESYTVGHNKFSDWADWEYKNILTHSPMPEHEKNYVDLPEANATPIDWRSKGAVTPVKDQGQCGSCWSFSATGALEGAHKIKTGTLKSFSEQELVDCSTANYGCNGGWQYKAFKYWQTNYAELETSYPYTARDGACKYSSTQHTTTKDGGYANVQGSNVSAMKTALAQQPLSVSVDAESNGFGYYKSGIYSSSTCGTSLDHATLVVGWGSSNGQEYWIMKNSWGTSWGEKGYMRLAIQDGAGICGIQKEPLYPTSVN